MSTSPLKRHLSIVPINPSSMISFLNTRLWGLVLRSFQENQNHSSFLGNLINSLFSFHFHNSCLKVNGFESVWNNSLCLNIIRGNCNSEPFFLTEIFPFATCLEGFTVIHNYNLATNEIIALDNLLLPKILAYNTIQAQNKGMFYQCNWTAWLQRALLQSSLIYTLCQILFLSAPH